MEQAEGAPLVADPPGVDPDRDGDPVAPENFEPPGEQFRPSASEPGLEPRHSKKSRGHWRFAAGVDGPEGDAGQLVLGNQAALLIQVHGCVGKQVQ